MKIGFIGAGNVGFSLAKYLNDKYKSVVGIYSKDIEDSKSLALFSVSEYYKNLIDLINDCDTLFLTVNDDALDLVVDELYKLNTKNKILIHTSGSISSDVFKKLKDDNYCYSLHPIYAFNDKYASYKNISNIYFTIEGSMEKLNEIKELFSNQVYEIKKEDKVLYHASCVMLSNFVCALSYSAENILKDIGIDNLKIFKPLILNNINNILEVGSVNALTGPVSRCDIKTIESHLRNIPKEFINLYKSLSLVLCKIAKEKNGLDYKEIQNLLKENKND